MLFYLLIGPTTEFFCNSLFSAKSWLNPIRIGKKLLFWLHGSEWLRKTHFVDHIKQLNYFDFVMKKYVFMNSFSDLIENEWNDT